MSLSISRIGDTGESELCGAPEVEPPVEETPEVEPPVEETLEGEPLVEETLEVEPPVEETPEVEPPVEETPEGKEGPHREPYTTVYTTGSSTVFINNLAVTTITSQGEQSCGGNHISIATTGSTTVFVENLGVHRVTDVGQGQEKDTYTSLTGSPDVFAG
jgi:hypothetical protein